MSTRLHAPEAPVLSRSGDHTSSAVGFLLGYMRDAPPSLGLNRLKPRTERFSDSEGAIAGHIVFIPVPEGGFSEGQASALEVYARSLTYWRRIRVELEWTDEEIRVHFRRPEAPQLDAEEEKARWSDRFQSRVNRGIRAVGKSLAEQGFMLREPASVSMITLERTYRGVAILVKYPYSSIKDRAGIEKAYEKWVPVLADVFAREFKVRAETMRENEFTTIFFTADPGYVSSLYDPKPRLRMLTPRGPMKRSPFGSSTSRACRALAREYTKYFTTAVKPIPAWGAQGHSMVLRYKPGAGGKIADDSYFGNVKLRAEKLMKHYHVQGAIRQHSDDRLIIVTFFAGAPMI